ncbi:TDP-N-acetylfucosamine:lipid II N-acetylfucosaminyltransferase [Rheinheimera sp. MMS21-TC3]|uniref:TDP-N-acetylfucosamine:lipid II N-acetylfucosaminyltransferase n=1 Tax=Rheinheimera sp. MMS21-TC3 TaxID=3072790 RepID=UPI0028C37A17|nr:TDP-N-acetylfucosamine:lipid II N-acetylfucosaminyltransferase [Rheinheimera sp. MMS21-TC3]WNO62303.1 TDP-N-acetylfucosamine:lipid II N-acetylfucosaminyltransferase [Rheinheimera sp. MMS21-TC3]
MTPEKFLSPFIDFVDKHFGRGQHKYVFITSEKYLFGLTPSHGVEFLHTDEDIFTTLAAYMQDARKIILHGLWRDKIDQLLIRESMLLEKSYWVMWGGDFYFPERHSDSRHIVIKNVKGLVTYIPKDIEYVRELYGAQGKHYRCLMYSSNVIHDSEIIIDHAVNGNSKMSFLLGNSASSSNNHFEIIEKISFYSWSNCDFYVPLSYGDLDYASKVISYGERKLGDSFKPITNYMSWDKYRSFLRAIDVGVFNHDRQQAMGVSIHLLGYGKKLYIKKNTAQWFYFLSQGIEVNDFNDFSPEGLNLIERNCNDEIVYAIHSIENLIAQWYEVFND